MKTTRIFLTVLLLGLSSALWAQDLSGVKILINPGHGGFDSDDRGISTPLIAAAPNQGFWESQSNLDKGLMLRDMLLELNCTVKMSRTTNTTEDDTPLSQIVQMANEFGADFMLSIHSNAGGGTSNYVLQLYAGKDADDDHIYPNEPPKSDESRAISTLIGENLLKNKMTQWTVQSANITGDKTYARLYMGWSNGYGVLRGLNVPGVISEGEMHDYIPETYRLLNMDYKWLEAWNFKKAFCTYFAEAEIPTGNIAGWVKDSRNKLLDGSYMKYDTDQLLPLEGAKVTVEETGEVYTTDAMRNGVYVFKDVQPGEYTLKAEAEGYHSQTQKVAVVKNEIAYFNFELNMIRNTPPEVIAYTPAEKEEVDCSANVVLEFNWDMDEESTREAFSIDPAVEGTISFEDSQRKLRFKPTFPLEPSTTYTVWLAKSAKHPDNLSMESDFSFSFTTNSRNKMKMLESFPAVGSDDVGEQPLFWFIFDQELDGIDMEKLFVVRDSEGTELTIDRNSRKTNGAPMPYGSYSFSLSQPLTAGEEYTVVISGELTDYIGIKLIDPIEIPFKVSAMPSPQGELMEDFEYLESEETEDKYIPVGDASSNVSTHTATDAAKNLFGEHAVCFRTRFKSETDAYGVFRLSDLEQGVLIPDRKVFGLYVYGDMSGNELQLEFSAGADVIYQKMCDLDFGGWKFVEMEYVNPKAGDTQYKLTGFRIMRNAEKVMSELTAIYLDNLLAYDELVNAVPETLSDTDIAIYPNPATDRVFVDTQVDERSVALQLYSLSGQLLKEVKGKELNVSCVGEGVYILKAKVSQKTFVKPVIIRQ